MNAGGSGHKKRTTYIVSAYMQKNEGSKIPIASSDASGAHTAQSSMTPRAVQQAPDVQAPGHTPKNALANAASSQFALDQRSVQNGLAPLVSRETVSDNSISPNAENSNASAELKRLPRRGPRRW